MWDDKSLEEMIGDAGTLLGQSSVCTNGKTVGENKNYKPKSSFGGWLQDLVEKEMAKAKVKHNGGTESEKRTQRKSLE